MRRVLRASSGTWRLAWILAVLALGAAACGTGDEVSVADVEDQTSDTVDVEALIGEVDELLMMEPGGFAQFEDGPYEDYETGPQVISSRHILRAETPNGAVDFFEVDVIKQLLPGLSDGDETSREERCYVTQRFGTVGLNCRPIEDWFDGFAEQMQQGGESDGTWLTLELRAPEDTTHMIITTTKTRIGVIPFEGFALVAIRQAEACGDTSTLEAFLPSGETRSETLDAFCTP